MSAEVKVPTYKAYTALIGIGAAVIVGYGLYKILSGPQKPIKKEERQDEDQHRINLGSERREEKVARVQPSPPPPSTQPKEHPKA